MMTATDSSWISRRGVLAGGALVGAWFAAPSASGAEAVGSAADLAVGRGFGKAVPSDATYAQAALSPRVTIPRQRHTMVGTFGSAGHGWTSNGIGTINLDNASDYALGSQCVSVTTSGGGNVWGQRSEIFKTILPFDLTSKAIKVWFRVVSGFVNLEQVRVLAGSGAANCYAITAVYPAANSVNNSVTVGQWGSVVVDLHGASTVCAPDKTVITYLNLRTTDKGGGSSGTVTVEVGGVALVDKPVAAFPSGVITLGFDDGYVDQFTTARASMDRYGFPGQAYVIGDLIPAVNTGGAYMGLDQLHKLEDVSGWEVSAHSSTVAEHNKSGAFLSLTDAQLRANLEPHKLWGIKQGFRGFDHFAYPQGLWNEATVATIREYFSTARLTAVGIPEMPAPNDPTRMRTAPINAGTSLATLTGVVDQVKAGRFWVQFYTHRVLGSGAAGTQIDTATFNGLVDYIAAAGVPVRTINEVLRPAAV